MLYNQPLSDASLIACPHCDLIQRLPEIKPGESARCPRCDKELHRNRPDPLRRTLPLAVAAVLLYVIANTNPMLGLKVAGREAYTTVFGGVQQLWRDKEAIVAVLVLFTTVIAPALQIGTILAVLIGALRERPPKWVGTILRYRPAAGMWSMLEVMMLGVLVSLIKIAEYARVVPGIALFVFGALIFLLAAIESSFDPREVWSRVEWTETDAKRITEGDEMTEVTS